MECSAQGAYMRSTSRFCIAILPALFLKFDPAPAQQSARKIEKIALCPDQSCKKGAAAYRPWELKLRLPAKLGQCTTYRTTPFFAVVLARNLPDTSEADCDALPKDRAARAGEAERLKAAAALEGRIVFLRMLCVGFGDHVEYGIEGETGMLKNFMAAFAGHDRAEAEKFLALAKTRYPAAALVSITARVENGDATCR